MKPSNCDLDDLWQGIAYTYEQQGRRLPYWLRLIYHVIRWLSEIALWMVRR